MPAQAFVIGSRPLPPAAEALARHGLAELEEPSDDADRLLLDASREADDRGALLCLRCRVSHPIVRKLRWMHGKYASHYGLDLLEMAARVLDDEGHPAPYQRPPQPCAEPFNLAVVRTFQAELCSLPHWAGVRLQGHPDLKAYLREHGLLLISDWALLANASGTRVREACTRFSVSALTTERAQTLHTAYQPLYREALTAHHARTGKRSGWTPDPEFLRRLASEQPLFATEAQLKAMAQAVRQLLVGLHLPPPDQRGVTEAEVPHSGETPFLGQAEDEDEQEGAAPTYRLVIDTLERVMEAYLPAVLAQPPRHPERHRCIWQAFADGCNQREQTERRCDCCQSTVSKTLRLGLHSQEIATRAAEHLRRQPAFASIGQSVEAGERMVAALRNHLLTPAQEGEVPLLRHWVAMHLSRP